MKLFSVAYGLGCVVCLYFSSYLFVRTMAQGKLIAVLSLPAKYLVYGVLMGFGKKHLCLSMISIGITLGVGMSFIALLCIQRSSKGHPEPEAHPLK